MFSIYMKLKNYIPAIWDYYFLVNKIITVIKLNKYLKCTNGIKEITKKLTSSILKRNFDLIILFKWTINKSIRYPWEKENNLVGFKCKNGSKISFKRLIGA